MLEILGSKMLFIMFCEVVTQGKYLLIGSLIFLPTSKNK